MTNQICEELSRYGAKMVQAGLVAGAGGNISARDGDTIWMKPSGLAMDDVAPDDWCGLALADGAQRYGELRPTSECRMHLELYRRRPEVRAVFHTHSPWASGVISAGVELKPMFAEFVCDLGRVGRIPYVTPTTEELAQAIGRQALDSDTIFMVNHGVLALGLTMKQAYYRCLVVEDAAKSMVAAAVVGRPVFLTTDQVATLSQLEAAGHRIKMMEASK
ncbi:MAG: class II aldolase/adducin family protein [Kiritimatiellia bacterium]